MKRILSFLLIIFMTIGLASPASATAGASEYAALQRTQGALKVLTAILAVLFLLTIVLKLRSSTKARKRTYTGVVVLAGIALAFAMLVSFMAGSVELAAPETDVPVFATESLGTGESTQATEAIVTTTEAPTEPPLSFAPAMSDSSNPENFGINWEIIVDDEIVDSYEREEKISFGDPEDYFALPGVATFRGNNYRTSATYGTATVNAKKLTKVWSHRLGSLGEWSGCAWTGQPLVVQWDEETKAHMDLYNSKKDKEGLVEVIYATLDGQIHFYDMEDGKETRKPINVGMNFKGAGALDPRGYPLLYVGSGVHTNNKLARMYVINLLTNEIMLEYGHKETFSTRKWNAFDSSPLVDAETDTLIWPGENGIFYTMKLNTDYDREAGTISIDPSDVVKTRYSSDYSEDGRYVGYESSVNIVDHYMYLSENGGLFYCIDLNTMELIWAQDTKDDSNSSPVFEWGEDGNGYIYTAPSLHWTAKQNAGSVSIYKLNAQTGEIVWEISRDCVTIPDVSGGVQATPLIGKEGSSIEDLIIYIVARVPKAYDGTMIAINRETGEVVWEIDTRNYGWSSPVAFYTEDGTAYIAFANASGKLRLLDGATGEILSSLGLDQTTEASPVVFNDMMVIGTREGVYGIRIS